jgi:hypothetical protein
MGKLSIQKLRKIDPDLAHLSDDEILEIRAFFCDLGQLMFDDWLENGAVSKYPVRVSIFLNVKKAGESNEAINEKYWFLWFKKICKSIIKIFLFIVLVLLTKLTEDYVYKPLIALLIRRQGGAFLVIFLKLLYQNSIGLGLL